MTLSARATDDLHAMGNPSTLAGRLFSEAPFPLLVVGDDGTILHANAQTDLLFGWSPDELVGKPIQLLVPLQEPEKHHRQRAELLPDGAPRAVPESLEVTARRRDGSKLLVQLDVRPLSTGDDRFVLVSLRDLSSCYEEAAHLRDLADRLAATNRELRGERVALAKIDTEKNALLGMAAHDLRTPLAVILGYAELLASAPPDEPLRDHREMVDAIFHTAKLMRRILDDLLDWSSMQAGTLRLASRLVDPVIVAGDAVALAGLAAARQGIPLSLEAEPDLPALEIDPERISQVLGNLLSNALKYSSVGDPVWMRIGRCDANHIEFTVTDHGQGIPRDFAAHMFRPFETGGNQPVDGERAIGLGLAIVKRIVDAHHGTVSVESELGRGSTFRVRLPIERPRSVRPDGAQSLSRSMSTNAKNATDT